MPCLRNKSWDIFPDSALFLDRDGVINKRIIDGYVKGIEEFEFLPGVLDAMAIFEPLFKHIFVVTNQQGVGKGLLSLKEVGQVHTYMLKEIEKTGGRINRIYMCPDLKQRHSIYRKPHVGMGLQAKKDFPNIRFSHSFMVGDSRGDLEFGARLGMHTALIGSDPKALSFPCLAQFRFDTLVDLASFFKIQKKYGDQ